MTIPPNTAGWTFANIKSKIRAVTGASSVDQMSEAQVGAYANNYLQYTMPHELKVQIENNFLKFKTTPGKNVYSFPGAYLTDSPGAYADGYPLIFYEDPDIFYQDWPLQYGVDMIASGTGSQVTFTGRTEGFPVTIGTFFITDSIQVLQDIGFASLSVTIGTATGLASYSGTLAAVPIDDGTFKVSTPQEVFSDNGNGTVSGSAGGTGTINYASGAWVLNFNAVVASGVPLQATYTLVGLGALSGDGSGTINYATGEFSATFNSPPPITLTVYCKYIAYQANRPQGILFFDNQFTLMPVPDQVYQIQMQGFVFPIALVKETDIPLQAEWGPLIAYGAAVEIFSDRGDMENLDRYLPMLKRYENIALGRTIQQLTPQQSVPRF
jgi:hypothetical protein